MLTFNFRGFCLMQEALIPPIIAKHYKPSIEEQFEIARKKLYQQIDDNCFKAQMKEFKPIGEILWEHQQAPLQFYDAPKHLQPIFDDEFPQWQEPWCTSFVKYSNRLKGIYDLIKASNDKKRSSERR